MGRIVAIGGGTFEETDGLNRRIVALSNKEIPNVLFIGTAASDSTNPLTSTKKSFKRVCPGCIVKKLSIVRSSYTDEEIDALLSWADIIYVGGGDTSFMLQKWNERGLTEKLLRVYQEDSAVLCGISAGAVCWFSDVYTDSEMFSGKEDWQYTWLKSESAIYQKAICPHYNDPKRAGFDEDVMEKKIEAIALSDCTAFVEKNGEISFISSSEGAQVAIFTVEGDHVTKSVMEPSFIG